VALDATMVIAGAQGERRVKAADFFQGLYTTAMQPGELLKACEIPVKAAGVRQNFSELSRRHGDYAVAGLAARAKVTGRTLSELRLVFLSLGDRPVRATKAEAALQGGAIDDARMNAADAALRAELDPFEDLTHSVAAKKQLAATLMRRAVARLIQEP
jgi:carbon-monoxide dehydrogenase medium subunit